MKIHSYLFVTLFLTFAFLSTVSAYGYDSYQPYTEYDSYHTQSERYHSDPYNAPLQTTKQYDKSTRTTYYPDGDKDVQVIVVRTTHEDYQRVYRPSYPTYDSQEAYWRYRPVYNDRDYPRSRVNPYDRDYRERYTDPYYYQPEYDWMKGYYVHRY